MSTRSWSAQKAGLTRALKTRDHVKIVAECRRVIVDWEGTAWPDDWHRWNRALDDAYQFARDAYVRGDLDELPDMPTDLDSIRVQLFREGAI